MAVFRVGWDKGAREISGEGKKMKKFLRQQGKPLPQKEVYRGGRAGRAVRLEGQHQKNLTCRRRKKGGDLGSPGRLIGRAF